MPDVIPWNDVASFGKISQLNCGLFHLFRFSTSTLWVKMDSTSMRCRSCCPWAVIAARCCKLSWIRSQCLFLYTFGFFSTQFQASYVAAAPQKGPETGPGDLWLRFRVHDYRNIAAFSSQHPHTAARLVGVDGKKYSCLRENQQFFHRSNDCFLGDDFRILPVPCQIYHEN